MKRLLLALSAFALSLTAHSQPAPVNPRPATQAQVNAGTDKFDFVTPATLAGWSGGGGSFGTMANQNANAVAITGGDASGITGSLDQFTNETLFGPVNYGSAGALAGSFNVFAVYAMPALAIDVTQTFNEVTLTDSDMGHPNETLTFSGVPAYAVQQFGVLISTVGSSTAHHVTIPSSWSFNGGSTTTSFWIQASSFVYLSWQYTGSAYLLRGDPRTIDDLQLKATPVTADEVGIYDSALNGVMKKATLASLPYQHSITFVLNGSGASIPSGTQVAYAIAGFTGTITKWKMAASPASSTIECDVFRIANASPNGNTLPTASIVGSGTKPKITSAVATYGTPSDWVAGSGSITLAENDDLTVSVTAGATAQYATLTLYYQ